MTSIHSLLQSGFDKLQHLETASLDSEVLLSHVLNQPREYILSHGEDEVPSDKIEQFQNLLAARAKHKPIAYLIQRQEFYGRDFYVDERVHIPGPATEDLIDYIKEFVPRDFSGTMADIGTGSGCIAITLAREYPHAQIMATDISMEALAVASRNIDMHIIKHGNTPLAHREAAPLRQRGVAVRHGNLLEPLEKPIDIIISNPPYGWPARALPLRAGWPDGWSDDPEVEHQPKISYDGGTDGLDIIKRLIQELPNYLAADGQAFIKFDPRRKNDIEKLLSATPFAWQVKKDLAGWDRIVRLTKV